MRQRRPQPALLWLRPSAITPREVVLRSLFTTGALAVIRYAKIHGTRHRPWLTSLLARRPTKVAAIALANKLARIAWSVLARGRGFEASRLTQVIACA